MKSCSAVRRRCISTLICFRSGNAGSGRPDDSVG
jgi:hypothetical protein